MSKTNRNKREFWEDEEERILPRKNVGQKRNKRIERALKTNDVSIFMDEDFDEDEYGNW